MTDERLKIWLGFTKFLTGTVALGVMTLIVDSGIKNRTLRLQEEGQEQEHLTRYIDQALSENVALRKRLAEFFSTVTSSEDLRGRWDNYLQLVTKEFELTEHSEAALVAEVAALESSWAANRENKSLERQLAAKKYQLAALRNELRVVPKIEPKADLANRSLRGADLMGLDLHGAHFHGADLYGALLTEARLTGADLSRADLRQANLEGADLESANLTDSKLTGANLHGAKGLSCKQLSLASDWKRAYRDPGMACDQDLPSN